MRTLAGCATCRRRKLKCDEKKPQCSQCRKSGRPCEPGELVFRHQQNPSINCGRDSLSKYFNQNASFNRSATWLAIPSTVSFVTVNPAAADHNGDPGLEQKSLHEAATVVASSPGPYRPNNSAGTCQAVEGSPKAFNAVSPASADTLSSRSAPSDDVHLDGFRRLPEFNQFSGSPKERSLTNIDFILNPLPKDVCAQAGGNSHAIFARPGSAASPESYLDYSPSRLSGEQKRAQPVETEPEVAFLLRHFSEQPGKWYVFPDVGPLLGAYFEHEVPLKALSHPLLKCAACAYAAKHLSRTWRKTDSPRSPLRHSQVATTTTWPNSASVDWAWHGARYYAEAIKLLREALNHAGSLVTTPQYSQASPESNSSLQSEDPSAIYAKVSDETLAAMAILCNFEFMSASDVEWTRHLNGTLLVSGLHRTGLVSLMSSPPSKARKAIFWNLFRQDVYASFILEGRTRMDIEDLCMWRAAGLALDDQGFVIPSNNAVEDIMKDDMISNALIWILSKVVNYIADIKEFQYRHSESAQLVIKDCWKRLTRELDIWYQGLPNSFQPRARIERKQSEPATESTPPKPATIPDIWYTSAMCASTIQTYHLARILLLIHCPHTSNQVLRTGAVLDFLNAYRNIEAELRYRCREIFGIALSSPTTSIMLHQTQTIYVAAQCLTEDDERQMVLDILRRANSDLGWETEYRVQRLLVEWGWDSI
ncbi:hypothetical protein F4677DRAFT_450924 [Hypoxylon crocopeplum]|nr:hypothetical protein F4677DRAFT_450924 [Hypoxylon crocopeplum]